MVKYPKRRLKRCADDPDAFELIFYRQNIADTVFLVHTFATRELGAECPLVRMSAGCKYNIVDRLKWETTTIVPHSKSWVNGCIKARSWYDHQEWDTCHRRQVLLLQKYTRKSGDEAKNREWSWDVTKQAIKVGDTTDPEEFLAHVEALTLNGEYHQYPISLFTDRLNRLLTTPGFSPQQLAELVSLLEFAYNHGALFAAINEHEDFRKLIEDLRLRLANPAANETASTVLCPDLMRIGTLEMNSN